MTMPAGTFGTNFVSLFFAKDSFGIPPVNRQKISLRQPRFVLRLVAYFAHSSYITTYQNNFTPRREDLYFSLRYRYEKTPVCYGYRGLKIIHDFQR